MEFLKGILLAVVAFFMTACAAQRAGPVNTEWFALQATFDGAYVLQSATCVSPDKLTIYNLAITEQWVDVTTSFAPERWSKVDIYLDYQNSVTRASLSGQVLTLNDGTCQATYLKN
jgi:hypothetical protein